MSGGTDSPPVRLAQSTSSNSSGDLMDALLTARFAPVTLSAHAPRRNGPTSAPTNAGLRRIALAPAIILRTRDRSSVAEVHERILAKLTGPEGLVPLGPAQLIASLDRDERSSRSISRTTQWVTPLAGDPLYPLEAVRRQREVLDHLRTNTAVVVQGPPGTGKTHTIANLTSALLAQGQRVALAKSIADLRARRMELLRLRAELEEEVQSLRQAETLEHEPAPSYRGTPAELTFLVAHDADRFDWMATPAPDAAGDLPLGVGLFSRSRDLLRTLMHSPRPVCLRMRRTPLWCARSGGAPPPVAPRVLGSV
jgi:AAA domain